MNKIFVSLILAAIFLVPGAAQAQTGKWRDIAMGSGHCLVLKSDGTLWAFGQNQNGQLGDGTLYAWGDNNASQLGDDSNIDRFVPVRTKTGVKRVACGHTNTMYIDNEGDLNVVGKLFW